MSDLLTPQDERWLRELLGSADIGPVPAPDADALIAAGRRQQRRTTINRAAVAASVAAVVGLTAVWIGLPRNAAAPSLLPPASSPSGSIPTVLTSASDDIPTVSTPATPSDGASSGGPVAFNPSKSVTKVVKVGQRVKLVGDAYLYLEKNGKCVVAPDGTTSIDRPEITQCRRDSGNQAGDSVSLQGTGWPTASGAPYSILTGLITSSDADRVEVQLKGTVLDAGLVKLTGSPSFSAWYLVLAPGFVMNPGEEEIVRVYAKDGSLLTSLP